MLMEVFLLLIVFQVKHFMCDYPLQTQYMLNKFKLEGWVLPLSLHAGTHAAATLLIVCIFTSSFYIGICLALIDFIIHFVVDRVKAHPSIGGSFKPDNPYFWWSLGVDQMTHHITHYGIIYIIVGA